MLPLLKCTSSALSASLVVLIGTGLGSSTALGDVIYEQDFENFSNSGNLWSNSTQSALGGTYSTVLGRFGAQTINLELLVNENNSTGQSGGGQPGSNPFNITVDQHDADRDRVPVLDGGNGGGPGGINDFPAPNVPNLNLGNEIQNQNGGTQPPTFAPGTYRLHLDLMLFDSWDGDFAPYGPDTFGVAMNGETLFHEDFFVAFPIHNFRLPDETPDQNVFHQNWADIIYRDIIVDLEITESTDRLFIEFIGGTSQSIADESWGIDNIMLEYIPSLRVSTPDVPAPGSLLLLGASSGFIVRRRRANTSK
ncbi:MAG: PEP-CTERM sorting domain-containing protein [Phycisphaerales bacterium]|nr:PEP-CTERM sorting domain-containing protein [Phycisphaerales bacterium]